MTLAAKTTKTLRSGFTLIEIVMVLAIAAIIMAGAVGLMVYSSDERTLRKTSGEIELMAKQARTIAILHHIPYALEFREGSVTLLPFAQAATDDKKHASERSEPANLEATASTEDRQLNLDGGMEISVRRWNSDKWLTTAKDAVQVWRFDPDGLCEPISVHISYGKSWAEDTYHPLTATIRDSQIEAR